MSAVIATFRHRKVRYYVYRGGYRLPSFQTRYWPLAYLAAGWIWLWVADEVRILDRGQP